MKPSWKSKLPEAAALAAIIAHVVNNPGIRIDSLSADDLGRALTGPLKNRPLA